jgi:hypothetical protein
VHVPTFWARAEHRFDPAGDHRVVAWRWSDSSLAEARAAAEARVAALAEALAAGRRPERADYADRPMREERLAAHPAAGEPIAIVTRNAQGAEVLNTARVPFLDLDFADLPGPGLLGGLRRLLGGGPPPDDEARALARVRRWLEGEGVARARVYRTRAGLRVLLLDRLLDPKGGEAQGLMRRLGADPLYARLCAAQGCFRARLTPKARRLGLGRVPHEWPAAGEAEAAARAAWVAAYREKAAGFAACRLLLDHGAAPPHPEAARVRELHDHVAVGFGSRPLA